MQLTDFDFQLPDDLIAQQPLPDRVASRLLRLERNTGRFQDRMFRELPQLLRRDDLLVFNNTRVFPARLFGHRAGIHAQPVSAANPAAKKFLQGKVEVLLTRQLTSDPLEWLALVHPGRKIGIGERILFGTDANGTPELIAEVIASGTFGERTLRFQPVPDFFAIVDRIGHIPLPPYIDRPDNLADRERYQTVFARDRGSAAAPTAGLHFTSEILQQFRDLGIKTAEITLHVGLGTFQPLRNQQVEENRLHREAFTIPAETANLVNDYKHTKRRIVAVGTTTVRTLEYAAQQSTNGRIVAGSGDVDLFIYPGFQFRVVDAMLTNFHLPKSSLLMLVCAFAGKDKVMRAYAHAVNEHYRFFSYGDCMFLE